LLEEEAEEVRAVPLALARAELAEEGRVGEAAQPLATCHGEPEEVFDVAHAGEDLLKDVIREAAMPLVYLRCLFTMPACITIQEQSYIHRI